MRVWHSRYWPKFIFCSAFLSTKLPHYKLWSTTCDKANRVPRICFADEVRDLLEVLFGIDNHWLWLVQLYWREHCVEIRHPVHHRDQSLQRSTREKRNAMKELEITRESSSTNTPPFCHFLISQIEACVDIFRFTLESIQMRRRSPPVRLCSLFAVVTIAWVQQRFACSHLSRPLATCK